ncbi:hypothetical protein, partial [Listeria monocytogenes]|uniref:hypothetical protein n=1 Tax=Listeria monocytogenes TaxID=1639 RepID=UPI001F40F82F
DIEGNNLSEMETYKMINKVMLLLIILAAIFGNIYFYIINRQLSLTYLIYSLLICTVMTFLLFLE